MTVKKELNEVKEMVLKLTYEVKDMNRMLRRIEARNLRFEELLIQAVCGRAVERNGKHNGMEQSLDGSKIRVSATDDRGIDLKFTNFEFEEEGSIEQRFILVGEEKKLNVCDIYNCLFSVMLNETFYFFFFKLAFLFSSYL